MTVHVPLYNIQLIYYSADGHRGFQPLPSVNKASYMTVASCLGHIPTSGLAGSHIDSALADCAEQFYQVAVPPYILPSCSSSRSTSLPGLDNLKNSP